MDILTNRTKYKEIESAMDISTHRTIHKEIESAMDISTAWGVEAKTVTFCHLLNYFDNLLTTVENLG